MALPTMSLRASPEYHQLIRDIATALRTRPELADVLRDVLQAEHGVTERDTDVLQAFQERLTIQSEVSRNIMAFAESINERLKALEQPEALRDTDGNTNVLQSILDRLSALERAIAQPAKARSRGRARDTKTSPPG
jgi:DNA repair ATPase RecN